jgi:hypothetical protein
MASSPEQRSSRKTASEPGETPAAAPSLLDPEAAAAVRRATLSTVRMLVAGTSTTSRVVARATVVSCKWLWPRMRKLGAAIGRGTWRASSATASWFWTRRGGVARLTHRGLWWTALAILIWVGQALLSADGDPELVEVALLWFAAGLTMSVMVLLGAPEARMRFAAFALASGHGSLAALAWVVSSAG